MIGGPDSVHDVVESAMTEAGIDISDRAPRTLTPDELHRTDIVITMGCAADGGCPANKDEGDPTNGIGVSREVAWEPSENP